MDFDHRCDNATWAATRTFGAHHRAGAEELLAPTPLHTDLHGWVSRGRAQLEAFALAGRGE